MFEEDWLQLGLAPTGEVAAIKKAYAARLKSTRPDDDALAYQTLREAYDRALQWARWQAQGVNVVVREAPEHNLPSETTAPPAPKVHDAPGLSAALDEINQMPASTGKSADELLSALAAAGSQKRQLSAEQVVVHVEAHWRQHGSAALIAYWPQVRHMLDDLPLSANAEISSRFADFVIRATELPDAFIEHLQRHFGWLDDYQTKASIGFVRANALHEAIGHRVLRPVSDPEVLQQFAPLLHLHRLLEFKGLRGAAALWFALLMGEPLRKLFADAEPQRLRALGVAANTQTAMTTLFKVAFWLRMATLPLLLFFCAAVYADKGNVTFAAGVGMLGGIVFGHAVVIRVGVWMWRWGGLRQQAGKWPNKLRTWHQHAARPWVGLGLLGVACACALVAPLLDVPVLLWLVWFFLLLPGALMLWPQVPEHGFAAMGAVLVATSIFFNWLAEPQQLGLAASLGLTWVLLGCYAQETGLWGAHSTGPGLFRPGPLWLFGPVINTLRLCDSWGYKLALMPAVLVCGLALGQVLPARGGSLFIAWVVAVLAAGALQGLLTRWAMRAVRSDTSPPAP